MTRFISYMVSLFIGLDMLILFLAVTYRITRRMIISFPIIAFPARRTTRPSNNCKAANNCRRGYHEQVAALRALQDEQGSDKVRALRPMV